MIKFKYKLSLLALLVLCSIPPLKAQEGYTIVTSDFEAWSKFELNYKFNKKWGVNVGQGFRFSQDASITDQIFTNVGFTFKPIKPLKFAMDLRYIYDRGGNSEFDNDFRINFDANYKQKLNRLDLTYRIRYQNRNEIGLSSEEGDWSKNYLRFRVKLNYNIKDWKLDPYMSTEIFRDLTRYTGSFDLLRFTVGTSYDFKKYGELGAFYRVERQLGFSYPKTTYVAGLKYTLNFKKNNNDK